MPVLVTWVGLGIAIATGVHVGLAMGGPSHMAPVVGLGLAAVALVVATCLRRGWACRLVVVALLCTAFAWGHDRAQRFADTEHVSSRRGVAAGVVSFEVQRASRSGARCTVLARPIGTGPQPPSLGLEISPTTWSISAPPGLCPVASGAVLRILARELAPPSSLPPRREPGAWQGRTGAVHRARVERVWVQSRSPSSYWSGVAKLRQHAWEVSRGDDALALAAAGVLGQVEALSSERRTQLRRSGLGHLIAVSGLHVAIAAWLAQAWVVRVAAWLGLSERWGVAISWVPVLLYVGLTGGSAPAVRAATMLGFLDLGIFFGRPVHGPTVLAAAAAVMLAVRPLWAADVGFQLSLAAMAVLVWSPGRTGLVLQTWRITWGIAPLTLLHFGQAGAAGLLANLVAIPLFSGWVLPLGVLGWALSPWLGAVALEPAAWGAETILAVAEVLGRGPPVPPTVVAAVGAALLVLRPLQSRKRWHRLRRWQPPLAGVIGAIAVVIVSWLPSREDPVEPPPRAWWAIGSGPRPTVIATVVGRPHAVCIDAPGGSASRWPATLGAFGVTEVVRIRDGAGEQAPHVAELRAVLQQAQMWDPSPEPCAWPDAKRVRRAVRVCRLMGRGVVVVASDGPGGPLRCHRHGRWLPLRLHSPGGRS